MILSHDAILQALRDKRIIVEPFIKELVSINSIDVRLGPDLWRLVKKPYRDLYKTSDSDWQKVETISVADFRKQVGDSSFGQPILLEDDKLFILKSGSFYLGTTLEKIGTEKCIDHSVPIVPKMKAKSTVGRQGLTVALCAGLGDIGYKSRWALEIRVTDDGDVPIAIGTTIGQVEFAEATPTLIGYDGPDRYQNNEEIKFLPKPLKVVRS